jgi:hypothetical protein
MVRRVVYVMTGWPVIIIFSTILSCLMYLQEVPASHWLDIRKVSIYDSVAGEQILLAVDRTVNKEFFGTWFVSVREIKPTGVSIVCSGEGKSYYKLNSVYPEPLTLKWWSENCSTLPPGQYQVTTTWRWSISLLGLTFPKELTIDSNPFRVLSAGTDIRSWAAPKS